jgi:predicted nucleic acid-binding Zn ribbon protein
VTDRRPNEGRPGTPGGGQSSRPERQGARLSNRRLSNLTSVGNVLDDYMPKLRLEDRFAAAQATDLWREVVGPEVARRTRAVGVRDGELLIEVNGSVWMGHLTLLRRGYLDEINGRLPAEARLRAIRLTPMSDRTRDKEGA